VAVPAPVPASGAGPEPEPEPAEVPDPAEPQGEVHTKAKQTVPAADVMRRLDAVQTRVKDRRGARPGEAAALLAEVVDALGVAADDFSADEVSRVYSSVEAALQRVYDDCTPDAAAVLQQQQLNAELVIDRCASIGMSANQRGKLRKWPGKLAALARDIAARGHRAATEAYRPLPVVLSQKLGSEMFALFLRRLPDSATTAAQKEIVARIDRAVRTRTGHPNGAVHVFGSAASGFGGSGSDIDLCAELPKEQAKTNQLYASLRQHKARLAEIEAQFPDIPRRAACVSYWNITDLSLVRFLPSFDIR
jgi:predicted nucleotidyltransferase